MFDLTNLQVIETAEVVLKDGKGIPYADDKGNELKVLVFGPSSPVALRYKEKANRKANAILKNPNRKQDMTVEKFEEENRQFLIDMTKGFENFKIGELPEDEAIKEFYTNPSYKLLAGQVEEFLKDSGNFLPSA